MSAIIGTASWGIATQDAAAFDEEGTGLQRYASRLRGVEINSSFYRPHRPATWARWADSVPDDFRFAVKVPKAITHERKLIDCDDLLAKFIGEAGSLGPKLAVLLVQLPPSHRFQPSVVADFFEKLSSLTAAQPVCEPRHTSWFNDEADDLLRTLHVARVAADPAPTPRAALPGGWRGIGYWRLHGSPVMYRSAYGVDRLAAYAGLIREEPAAWCIFDNTASFAATGDALALAELLGPLPQAGESFMSRSPLQCP